MKYPAFSTKLLREPAWVAADPLAFATWVRLICAASESENGGAFAGALGDNPWTDAMWLPIANVTAAGVAACLAAKLAARRGDSLVVLGFERTAQRKVEGLRKNGQYGALGGRPRKADAKPSRVTDAKPPLPSSPIRSDPEDLPLPPRGQDQSKPTARQTNGADQGATIARPGSDAPGGWRSAPRAQDEAVPQAVAEPPPYLDLPRLFGAARSAEVSGLPWQSVNAAERAGKMALAIGPDAAARADVTPTMRLLFRKAKAGRCGSKSNEILRSPSFAFGVWCSDFTALREELHKLTPRSDADDLSAYPEET